MPFFSDLCSGVIGNCRNCMTTPLTRKRIFIFAGVALVVILLIIIICVSTINTSSPDASGSDALNNAAFVVGNLNIGDYLTQQFLVKNYNYSRLLLDKTVGAQVFTTSVNCSAQFKDAVSQTMDQLDFIRRLIANSDSMEIAYKSQEISTIKDNKKSAVLLALGGGHSIDTKLSVLRSYYNFGVRVVTVASMNCTNPWAMSIAGDLGNITKNGSDFMKGAIAEMNRLGIVIDVAGSNKSVQETVIRISKTPIIYRGVGLSNRVNHKMNVDEDTLEKLKNNHGLVMLSLDCTLITNNTVNCTMQDFIDLLKDAKTKLGAANIGIGGVVDPNGHMPSDLSYKDFPKLFNELKKKHGWTMKELEGLAGTNFLNILQKVEEMAKNNTEKPDETFFDVFSFLPKNDTQCYSAKKSKPDVSPNSTEPMPSPKPINSTTRN